MLSACREVKPSKTTTEPEVTVPLQHLPKMDSVSTTDSCALSGSQTKCDPTDDVTAAVLAALHFDSDIQPHYTAKEINSGSPSAQLPAVNVSQLRLPSIKSTSNVAANLMSEECDLGYSSFTDLPSMAEVIDSFNCSNNSDMFSEANPSFEDIIDDVLEHIDRVVPVSETLLKQEDDHSSKPRCDGSTAITHITPPKLIQYQQSQNYVPDYSYIPTYPNVFNQAYFMIPGSTHMPEAANIAIPYCNICNKSFQTKTCLRVHMRSHRGERPHICSYCDKCFTQKSTLRTHIRTHTGEKPYVCKYCSRAFSDYSTFRKHVRVHTGEKPYVCDVCKKGFTQSGNMLRHREVHFKKSSIGSLI